MNLNLWQWIGIILMVLAAILFWQRSTADAPTNPAPTTQAAG